MLLNTVLGFLIPWIFGIWLIGKNKRLVFVIFPFSSIVSHTINSFGCHANYWKVKPLHMKSYSFLPFDLGLFALLGCLLIYIIQKTQFRPYIILFTLCFITTLLEFTAVEINMIVYDHGWNIFYTFFSYLIAYALVYWYYLLAKKFDILD